MAQSRRSKGSAEAAARVTARDVASAAGISTTTVSHALSGRGRINAETRIRVRQLADEMGYVPDARAVALKTGEAGVLAFVSAMSPQFERGHGFDYVAAFGAAAAREALSSGLVLALIPAMGRMDWLRTLAMDGVLVSDPVLHDPLLAALRARAIPYVCTGPEPGRPADEQWWVSSDERTATTMALDHMAERGARRIALMVTSESRWYAEQSRATYEAWTAERGQRPQVCLLDEARTSEGAREAIIELLGRDPTIDGAYAPESAFGVGILEGALAVGRSIPNQFKIVTMDGMSALAVRPQLTGVEALLDETATYAVQMLVQRTRDADFPPVSRLLQPRLIVRAST